MLNMSEIKARMEVVGTDGVLVGTVDRVDGDRLNLAKTDIGQGARDTRQHYLPTGLVASIKGNKVHLSAKGNVATKFDDRASPSATPGVTARSNSPQTAATPWNWNKIGLSAIGIAAGAAGAAGAAFFSRKAPMEDDFEFRLETDESVRLISSDKVEGTAVIGTDGEILGHIKSFMVDQYTGRVAYAIMTFAETNGAGNAFFPLPWPMLEYDVTRDGYALEITKDQLANAPRFDGNTKVEFTPDYRRKLILFYRS